MALTVSSFFAHIITRTYPLGSQADLQPITTTSKLPICTTHTNPNSCSTILQLQLLAEQTSTTNHRSLHRTDSHFFVLYSCLPCVYDFLIFFSKYIPPNSGFHAFACYHTLFLTTGVRSGMMVECYTSLVCVRVRVMYQDFYTSPFETSIFPLPFCIIILWYTKILHFSTKTFLKN